MLLQETTRKSLDFNVVKNNMWQFILENIFLQYKIFKKYKNYIYTYFI